MPRGAGGVRPFPRIPQVTGLECRLRTSVLDMQAILVHLVELEGSDLHVKAGSPPRVRINGDLRPTPFPTVSGDDIDEALANIMPAERMPPLTSITCSTPGTTSDSSVFMSRPLVGSY